MSSQGLAAPQVPEPVPWLRLLPTAALAILAVIVTSLAAGLHAASHPEASNANRAPLAPDSLGLRVASKPQQVEIFWNHASSAIQAAESGTIRISDGDIAETVPFDAPQLQDGALVYRPRTNDVNIRMEVKERDGQQISESLRTVATP